MRGAVSILQPCVRSWDAYSVLTRVPAEGLRRYDADTAGHYANAM